MTEFEVKLLEAFEEIRVERAMTNLLTIIKESKCAAMEIVLNSEDPFISNSEKRKDLNEINARYKETMDEILKQYAK